MFLFQRPTAAEERALRRQAAQWQALARRSGRAEIQALLPRGHREVFQIKVVLEGSKPPIWRRLLVPSDLRLPDLHRALQLAMGWRDCHPYQFIAGMRRDATRCYGDPQLLEIDLWELGRGDFIDARHVPIDHLLVNVSDRLRYEYDFGDGWMHRLSLEAIQVKPLREARIPVCLEGRRACPPESVGGILGYEQALEAAASAEPAFDPEPFDPEPVNLALAQAFAAPSRR